MNYERYDDLRFTQDCHYFLFYSDGPKGRLKKLIVYAAIGGIPNAFNLGFGTLKMKNNGEEYLDGTEISDNGDRNKILATIAATAYRFIDKYPDKKIYLTGSDKTRTRLYQMAINHAFEELSETFKIYGDIEEDPDSYNFQPFTGGVNYTGFLIEK